MIFFKLKHNMNYILSLFMITNPSAFG